MKSDYYHSHMDKADRAKKAKDRLSKKESLQDKLSANLPSLNQLVKNAVKQC